MSGSSSSIISLPPYASASTSRLQALYSDISRQKHSNPTSYQSNIEWWRGVLELVVSSGLQTDTSSRLVLSCGAPLMERLRIQGVGKPLSLAAVVTELQASKQVISHTDFLNSQKSIYDPGWLPARIAAFVVGKPLWWALEQIGFVGEEGILGGSGTSQKGTAWWGEYVSIALVERAANEVLERQAMKMDSIGERLYSLDRFKLEFGAAVGGDGALTEGDAMVLLKFLSRDRSALVHDKDIVKFLPDDFLISREINAVDRGILELRSALQNLHAQVVELQRKMDECTQRASAAIQQKRKIIALSHLRLRRELEDLLAKRLSSLDNLEVTLLRVEAAAGDMEIMKTYESSTATLRALLAHPSLQKDSIDATLDALAEVNANAKEVDDAVRSGVDAAVGIDAIDDDELEKELKALSLESEREKEKVLKEQELSKRLEVTGKVPSRVPVSDDETSSRVALA